MRRAGFTARTRRGVGTLAGRIDVGKPTTNWPSDSAITFRPKDRREAEALVVPGTKFPRDGEWHPENAALQQAAGASSALVDFYREQQEIEVEIRRYERQSQETGEPIAEREAGALANRIKNLRLLQPFDGREDFIKFRAGRCLTLKEGQAAGLCRTATASLEAKRPPAWAGSWLPVTLAIPAELQVEGPDATFGAQTFQWLRERCETLVREIAIRGFPPGSPASQMFDGGGFALVGSTGSPRSPGPDAVPVVLAPDEDAIRESIEHAASCPDHWDALAYAVEVLCKCRQPLGDALGAWTVEALRGGCKRPDARKAAKSPAKALRNHAIIEAVRELERCGMKVMSDREPGPACDAVAEAFGEFGLRAQTVLNIWKSR